MKKYLLATWLKNRQSPRVDGQDRTGLSMTKHCFPTRSELVALWATRDMIKQINKIARSRQMSFSEWTRQAMAAALKREAEAARRKQRAAA
jgi:hypothetical protein